MQKSNNILITGAAGAIGVASAHLLHQQGYQLILVDKQEPELKKLSHELSNSSYFALDVTDPKAMKDLFNKHTSDLYGLVLAAGIEGPVGVTEDCTESDFLHVMSTNVLSVWLAIKYGLNTLKIKNNGSIVVLSSISGVMAAPMLSPYCASKHAVIGLVKTIAREVASYGIRINAVCPGPVKSKMMERIDATLDRATSAHTIPIQRYATPEEVAKMIVFLCSDASSYCTGTSIMVDGGLTCR